MIRFNVIEAPAIRITNPLTGVTVSQRISGLQGPEGPQGVPGPRGEQGPAGLAANVPQDLIDSIDMTILFENALA